MSTKLTTAKLRNFSANNFIEVLSEAEADFYFFIGNHNPAITTAESANSDEYSTVTDVYNNMIAGKKITPADIYSAIRNVPYVSNTVYDMYDDVDIDVASKDFFVITDEGSYKHVYKCLDNNMRNPSTIEPAFSHISGSNTQVYQTSDGYRWKYMYSVSSSQNLKFSSSSYFPIIANSTVSTSTVRGAVDIVKVEGIGKKYDNYVTGTLSSTNIRVSGNSLLYEIANATASSIESFYDGCLMYLSSGTGSGQYSRVDYYFSNGAGKYVVLDTAFDTSPVNGTEYEIYPEVKIYGTGIYISNCVARALINSVSSNSVYRVEMLDRGSGYDFVYSANVVADSSVNITLPAELRAINSPYGGHGKNAAAELYSNSLIISVKFSNTETGTIPANNGFKQIGIIKNPIFANVSIEFANNEGTFSVGESAFKISTYKIESNATINTTSNVVTCNSGDFLNQLEGDSYVFIKSSDTLNHQLAIISSISNSSEIVLATNGYFSCTETIVYKTVINTNDIVVAANNTNLLVNNVTGSYSTGDQVVGFSTGAYNIIKLISNSDVSNTF